jgi:hypothetical protein
MIADIVLAAWQAELVRGERLHLHRSEQREMVEELIQARVQLVNLEGQIRVLQVHNAALNETLSITSRRGDRSGGLQAPDESAAKHGVVARSGPIMQGLPIGTQCDWGGCSNVATCIRFDAFGCGWLPCCEECSIKGGGAL